MWKFSFDYSLYLPKVEARRKRRCRSCLLRRRLGDSDDALIERAVEKTEGDMPLFLADQFLDPDPSFVTF